ncbi:MAG: hypothetical protein ACYC26_08325 [Phycisphaerales bacterium]
MSTIGSGIAASAAQALVQTNQSAKGADATRNRDQALAKKMRDLLDQHTHEVENSTETDGSKARIHEEERDHTGRRRRHHQAEDYFEPSNEQSAEAEKLEPAPDPATGVTRLTSGSGSGKLPPEPTPRLDITA